MAMADSDGREWFTSAQCDHYYLKPHLLGIMSPSLVTSPLLH